MDMKQRSKEKNSEEEYILPANPGYRLSFSRESADLIRRKCSDSTRNMR
jgi:hypothetical protein